MSKLFSTRVKALFPNSKNSKKKSAQEIEEELDSVLGGLSGEVSALQRELGLIRSQISVDGEYIRETLETIAAKEHLGFKVVAEGQESVHKQILETIRACQAVPPPAQDLASTNHAAKLREKEWEQELLLKAKKLFHAEMQQHSRKNQNLEKEIGKLKQHEARMQQELKMLKQKGPSTALGPLTPLKSMTRDESQNRLGINESASKDSMKKSIPRQNQQSYFGNSTKTSMKRSYLENDRDSDEDQSTSEEKPSTSKRIHWSTLRKMQRLKEESERSSSHKKKSIQPQRLKDKLADES